MKKYSRLSRGVGRFLFGMVLAFNAFVGSVDAKENESVVSYVKSEDGLVVETSRGELELEWYGEAIMRVRFVSNERPYTHNKAQLDRTMLVESAQQKVDWSFEESKGALVMRSSSLIVKVNRSSAAVAFYNKDGNELLSERPTENRVFEPFMAGKVATQKGRLVFNMDDEDALYGMGQHQDGFMNRRHVPTRLVQHNTRISLPVVVSPAGYGLFFNHMTQMDYNEGSSDGLVDLEITNFTKSGPMVTEEDMATKDKAKRALDPKFLPACTGTATYTPTVSGPHGFYIRHDAHFKRKATALRIWVDDEEIVHYINFWNETSMGGVIDLEAGKTVKVEFDGSTRGSTLQVSPPDNRFEVAIESAEDLDYFFMGGDSIDQQIQEYRQLTGAAPIPPKYMFGFWQCRERYHSQNELLENAREFRDRNIPVDIIVQDWQWWTEDNSRVFNSDYPEPAKLMDELDAMNYHVMFSVWAETKNEGDAIRWGQERLNGDNLNVYDKDVRELFWGEVRENLFDIGADAWWFDSTEGFPINDREQTEFGPGFMHHNDFSLFVSKAAYEGQRRDGNDATRPVILTRSAWGGQQRYGSVMWSGDISSTWDHYRKQIAAGLNFCMGGVPYWTTDTAGFFRTPGFVPLEDGGAEDNQYTSEYFQELLIRWMQYSTFCPVQRIHGYQSETEMWRYEADTYANLLKMVKLRYRILPYSYSMARMTSKNGYTPMRGLAMDFGDDLKVSDIYDQFMYGPAFMACPVVEKGARSREVYLPEGTQWIDFWNGGTLEGGQHLTVEAPLDRMPLYVKAGSIVPCGPDVEWAEQKPWDDLEIRIYPGADGRFTLYEDEGENHNYERGKFSEITFVWNEETQSLRISDRVGKFSTMLKKRRFHVSIVRPGKAMGLPLEGHYDKDVEYVGKSISVEF